MRFALLVFLAACGGGRTAPPDAPEDVATAAPTEPAALQAWLAERTYQDWDAESARHPSEGPHGGNVRTFLSPSLAASLAAGTDHPAGAADYQGVGLDLCSDCHVAGEDYVLIPFPLR